MNYWLWIPRWVRSFSWRGRRLVISYERHVKTSLQAYDQWDVGS